MKDHKPLPFYAKSIAFDQNSVPHILIRQGKDGYFTQLTSNDKLQVIKKISSKYWWCKSIVNQNEHRLGLFTDDDLMQQFTAISLTNDQRGKKITKEKAYYFHHVASTCNARPYFFINKCIWTYKDNTIINLHEHPEERLPEEQNATFFIYIEKGLFRSVFSDKPANWEHIYKPGLGKPKQLVYDPHNKLVVAITNVKGSGWVHFIDTNGKATTYEEIEGLWSVAIFQSRYFFYRWGNIIEITKEGKKTVHEINGKIARNQCLFASSEALYFVCEHEIHRYSNDKWSVIPVTAQNIIY